MRAADESIIASTGMRRTTASGTRSADSPRVDVLGVGISAIRMSDAVSRLETWIAEREREYVCVVPAHSVMDCQDDPELRAVVNAAGLVTPDGMSLVWLLRRRGYRDTERVYGPDLMLAACERSLATGWRHFFLGGEEGVAAELAARLQRRFPGLAVAGTLSPPFRALSAEEDAAFCKSVNETSPDVVWVGLGSPKQERWMAAHRKTLRAPVLVGVGAAFDFLSGRRRQAPRWIQRSGFEWLFRLAAEPRRLWRRYIRYPRFVLLVLQQTLRSQLRAGTQTGSR
jgi:N-acetylglucosaminyldiphosphoundecaprenol N-acetyl-beta-D-mannosaminyltransferase